VPNGTRLTWEGYLKAWRCCKGRKRAGNNKKTLALI
jgi:hypothetical protein